MSKSKLQQVLAAVVEAVGDNMSRWQAVECAEYLLTKHHGNVHAAIHEARMPFKIDGKFTY